MKRSLWQRAPLWRFSALSFAMLLLLSLLYPPQFHSDRLEPPPPVDSATYTVPPGAPQPQAAAQATPPVIKSPPIRKPPSVAQLSLATPATQTTDKSGIDPALLGRTYHDYLLADGFKVPLPRGDWAMLANSTVKALKDPNNTGMNYFLAQIENKRLVGAIQIVALRSPASPGTGFPAFECNDPSFAYAMKEDGQPFGHQACWVIHNWFTPPWQEWADRSKKMSELTRAAAGEMAAKGITYPQDLVDVEFYRSESWGLLEVHYLFSPEKEHISSNIAPSFRDSDWWALNLRRYPEKLRYVEAREVWGASFWPRFKQAFDAGQSP